MGVNYPRTRGTEAARESVYLIKNGTELITVKVMLCHKRHSMASSGFFLLPTGILSPKVRPKAQLAKLLLIEDLSRIY